MYLRKRYLFFVFVFVFPINVFAVCVNTVTETTPTVDFTVHNDGTVTHISTGLMWQVCSQGQTWNSGNCLTGTASTHTWQEALQTPITLNANSGYAGYSNWRLPNIKELNSIAELSCYSPAINETIFPNTTIDEYWASSPTNSNDTLAGFVYFYNGGGSHSTRNTFKRVRLVRGGQ